MNTSIRGIAVVAMLLAAGPVAAQTCNPDIPRDRPDERYTDHNDGTVTDSRTGLMWMRCSLGQAWDGSTCSGSAATYDWQAALRAAREVNNGASNADGDGQAGFAGHADWRLPNLKELKSLAETACYGPAINTRVFPATPPARFWSSSPVASDSYRAWNVGFSNGQDSWGYKYFEPYVRLVRAGQ